MIMQISITSTLTEEQALILAKEKGYNEIVNIIVDDTVYPCITEETKNPQSPFDFLKNVYENMIKEDAKRLFIAYDDRLNISTKMERENAIKDMVDSAFL
jgi:hypothetical protein